MSYFNHILAVCRNIAEECPDHVFIGGVAVYLHAKKSHLFEGTPEASHDADLMVSLVDLSDLRDHYELSPTRRLHKYQLIKDDVEFDIYVERQNELIVPYDEARSHANEFDQIRVLCLEHLLALKLDAFADRHTSDRGTKDARDIVTIAICSGGKFNADLALPFLRDNHIKALESIVKRSPVFYEMAKKNAHEAKKLRGKFSLFVKRILREDS